MEFLTVPVPLHSLLSKGQSGPIANLSRRALSRLTALHRISPALNSYILHKEQHVKNLIKAGLALVVALLALSATSQAQTVVFNGIGSSALFLEAGQATSATGSGILPYPECIWTGASSSNVFATDPTVNLIEKGQVWIAWTTAVVNHVATCTATNSTTKIYAYLQTDSVVGDRCLFNGCYVTNTTPGTQATANLVWPTTNTGTSVTPREEIQYLPAGIAAAFKSSVPINVAGTDIRPEDAEFATTRATTPCGVALTQYAGGAGNSTQYLGLGYTSGSSVNSYFSSSTFHIVSFTLPSTFYVTPVGADPIVVAVNSTDASGTGFNSANIVNLDKSTLALYLDGSIGSTGDALTPAAQGSYTPEPTTVIIREPVSGTYNTMEYNIPNTVAQQTSQDVGLNQPTATQNCTGVGGTPLWNTEGTPMGTLASGAVRERAIGTGQELAETFATNDSLGYGFWSISNFAAAPTTAKYLTVDGVDPLANYANVFKGVIPTSSTAIKEITFTHVIDGSYPIWSLVRLVTTDTATQSIANQISLAAAKFSLPVSHPDFVPYYTTTGTLNLQIERAHFTPPAIYTEGSVPAPQNGDGLTYVEAGGDVGGAPIPVAVDTDYVNDTGSTYTSTVSGGQGVPTSFRRQ
jgi:hypothetical protein